MLVVAFSAATLGVSGGCIGTTKIGSFPDPRGIGSELVRHESVREDVLRVLGEPSGRGSSVLPPDHTSHEVWYYEDTEAGAVDSRGNEIWAEVEQDILLVFFEAGRFSGYLWYSNRPELEGEWRSP